MSKVLNKYVISEPFASVTALKAFDTSAGDGVDPGVIANVLVDNASASAATINLYAFSALATTAGNDDTIVTPDNITEPAAGRWLKITDRQIAGIIANNEHGYFGSDTGAADAYVVDVAGTLGSYGTGLRVWVLVGSGNTNTGASTINIDAIGAANIKLMDGNDPVAGDILADSIIQLVYDGTNFQLLNPQITNADVDGFYATDAGAADAYDGTVTEAPAIAAGLRVWLNVANPNTGASTMTINGGATADIKLQDGNDPIAGDLATGKLADLIYDGTNWQLLNPRVSLAGTRDAGSSNITSINYLELDPIAEPSHSEGLFFYNDTEKSPSFYNDESNVTLNIGQEGWVRVYNDSGAQIDNGDVVYISGAEGAGENRPEISLAQADAAETSKVLGLATHDIGNASYGWVTRFGLVNNLNTASYTAGDPLYLDAASAGGLTATAPSSPNTAVFVGVCTISNASTGQILVFPTNEAVSAGGGGAGSATQLTVPIRKGSAGTINPGEVVYVTGYHAGSNSIEVELADASSSSTMPAIGISIDTITNSTSGTGVVSGRVANVVDTSSFSVGDVLYVSETAGALTATKPQGTALIQNLGIVARSNASNGVVQMGGSGRSNDLPNLPDADIWIGDSNGVPQAQTISGDATLANDGTLTVIGGQSDGSFLAINQSSHGFSVGNWLYNNAGTYTAAANTSAAAAEVVGVVSSVEDTNNFTLQINGYAVGLSSLSAGTVYFLGTAGALTATEPSSSGEVSKPLLVADSTTTGIMLTYRGEIIP